MSKEKERPIFNESGKNDEIHMDILYEDEKWIYAEISKNDFREGRAPLGSMLWGEEKNSQKNTFKIAFPKNKNQKL